MFFENFASDLQDTNCSYPTVVGAECEILDDISEFLEYENLVPPNLKLMDLSGILPAEGPNVIAETNTPPSFDPQLYEEVKSLLVKKDLFGEEVKITKIFDNEDDDMNSELNESADVTIDDNFDTVVKDPLLSQTSWMPPTPPQSLDRSSPIEDFSNGYDHSFGYLHKDKVSCKSRKSTESKKRDRKRIDPKVHEEKLGKNEVTRNLAASCRSRHKTSDEINNQRQELKELVAPNKSKENKKRGRKRIDPKVHEEKLSQLEGKAHKDARNLAACIRYRERKSIKEYEEKKKQMQELEDLEALNESLKKKYKKLEEEILMLSEITSTC